METEKKLTVMAVIVSNLDVNEWNFMVHHLRAPTMLCSWFLNYISFETVR